MAEVWLATLFSGAAGLINQVIWQRALKVYLGGSEALSSMVVVLVFMLGLGAGANWAGQRAGQLRQPIKTLATIEAALALANLLVCLLLSLDLSRSVYAMQSAALESGLPLRLIYGLTALLLLLGPCWLMGATTPLLGEVLQCQMEKREKQTIPLLFFVNTLGAVAGSLLSGFYLLPWWGQRRTLLLAVAMNLAASGLLMLRRLPDRHPPPTALEAGKEGPLGRAGALAFALGGLSLSYEIYLFRWTALLYEPLPFTFAATLSLFLLFWAVGALLAHLTSRLSIALALGILSALMVCLPPLAFLDLTSHSSSQWGSGLSYFVPCIFFGYLNCQLLSQSAQRWGHDIGRLYSLNTLGACLGIVVATLVGYQHSSHWTLWAIGAGLAATCLGWSGNQVLCLGLLVGSLLVPALLAPHLVQPGVDIFWDKDGVVTVEGFQVKVDGLWHSNLLTTGHSEGDGSWLFALAPLLAHDETPIRDVLVVGTATCLTASVLSQSPQIERVDGYEINFGMHRVMEKYPKESLDALSNRKLHIVWRDARSGMALNPRKYDLITTAPLYLKQAGSSLLLSQEYFQLINSRLADHGVLGVYSNSMGNFNQALLVRQTLKSVFPYTSSLSGGYFLLASRSPIRWERDRLQQMLAGDNPLLPQLRLHASQILTQVDNPSLIPWSGLGSQVILDDWPIVEYPGLCQQLR